jgi:hypothetical protein
MKDYVLNSPFKLRSMKDSVFVQSFQIKIHERLRFLQSFQIKVHERFCCVQVIASALVAAVYAEAEADPALLYAGETNLLNSLTS